MQVTKRKDGRYMKRISINGKIKTIYGKTSNEVLDKYYELQYLSSKNMYKDNSITFSKWANIYITNYKNDVSYRTLKNYKSMINNHINPIIGNYPLKNITQLDIQHIFTIMDSKKLTKTKQQVLILIKSILNKAIENDIITKNVALGIKFKPHKSKEKVILLPEQIKFFKSHCEQNANYFLIYFAIYTGLRRGELTALTKNDINLRDKTITINKSCAFINNQPIIKSTKNEETRIIPIFNILYDKLKSYLQNINTEYLFTKTDGSIMSETCIRRKLQSINYHINKELNANNKTKIDYSISLHQTRHTYASILHDAGIDVKQAQAWTGHKEIKVLLDIYTHLDKLQSKKSIDKVNEFLA